MRQQATLISKAYTADVAFQPDTERQYLMVVLESGEANLTFGGGDGFAMTNFYEPYIVPINEFSITGITGRVIVITNQSTLNKQV